MPKIGMEPLRRRELIDAAIAAIGARGSLDVTMSDIASRAGVSSALAHHYFGSKEQIFLAAMRWILGNYGAEVRGALSVAVGPEQRLRALVIGSFATGSFRREAISAWLNFYVLAQTQPEARRLLRVYQRRVRSNLRHELRQLVGERAEVVARGLGALIDGVYIRAALADGAPDRAYALKIVTEYLDRELEGRA